ncbi:hypothetical protein CfE428DRAFT_6683 [Chthoniobacter flavus Ellin428]|uniref:Uncharacterized protein n=1 Tax=Chthoniobacter flavus Ellin428 TaxID=497964 RepID=B4DCP2_9BACT|nr:hypothetical protein [Chthoniobacter flavus]EDY15790.1 hypothetical protein CfE428DRAFT_6683 [Chthoniobacter flavus Ellin428]TCO84210.1 hypothetical protein EV701_1374 [Chthoniobacter flavus]
MPTQAEIPTGLRLEKMLDARQRNPLTEFLSTQAQRSVPAEALRTSKFDHYLVQKRADGTNDAFRLDSYSEEELYGIAGSPALRFRRDVERLKLQVAAIKELEGNEIEVEHLATLLWADIGRLTGHLGASPQIDEIVANLRVARAQFVAQPTPLAIVEALGEVFEIVVRNAQFSTDAVDEALDRMEAAGVDLNFPLQFAKDSV